MYLNRFLDIVDLLSKKSFFLFGPRSTGKTSLIEHQLGDHAFIIDLLRSDVLTTLMSAPWSIEGMINKRKSEKTIVVIDEIQKFPPLLNEVHRLIESQKIRFLLTGSSARKLRKADVNLLGGRAWEAELFPLVKNEIPDFSLERYLQIGGLPHIYLSDEPEEELAAYASIYMNQEILAEALVRKTQPFAKFLRMAAFMSGKLLNFTEVGSDAGVSPATIRAYYQILEDTLLGKIVEPWTKTVKRKAISTGKFYFFDVGVRNHIAQIRSLSNGTDGFGQAFEHFIYQEIRAYLSYTRNKAPLTFWQAKHGQEVDFLIGDMLAIEVKSSQSITSKHLQGLKVLQEEKICQKYILVSLDRVSRIEESIDIVGYEEFLKDLWQGEYDKFMVLAGA